MHKRLRQLWLMLMVCKSLQQRSGQLHVLVPVASNWQS